MGKGKGEGKGTRDRRGGGVEGWLWDGGEYLGI